MAEASVELHPGRAAVRIPGEHLTVELPFKWHPKLRQVDSNIGPITVTPDPGRRLPPVICFLPFREALEARIAKEPIARTLRFPKDLPREGQPLDIAFYEQVVGLQNRFMLEQHAGSVARVVALAHKAGHSSVEPAHVRLWVHRGRKYLAGERSLT